MADTIGMKSEAQTLIEKLEALANTSRTTGRTFKTDPAKGDGYWCPRHESGCFRRCDDRRWGKYGAAGVLFFHRESQTFLLNQRSKAIHFGGTWSTLGGAIDKSETPLGGALREAEEEIGRIPVDFWQMVAHENVTNGEHTDWTYTTFVVEVDEQWIPESGDWESMGNEWVTLSEMSTMPLHPGFKESAPALITEMYYSGMFR